MSRPPDHACGLSLDEVPPPRLVRDGARPAAPVERQTTRRAASRDRGHQGPRHAVEHLHLPARPDADVDLRVVRGQLQIEGTPAQRHGSRESVRREIPHEQLEPGLVGHVQLRAVRRKATPWGWPPTGMVRSTTFAVTLYSI